MDDIREAYLQAVDVDYSYRLAKKMETFKTNPVLGYRTAGSQAEIDTGNMLAEEMRAAGLQDIHMDRLTLDSWEFKKAVLRFEDRDGVRHEIQLGAYQTNFVTDGFQKFELTDLGKGTAEDYEGRDVAGKLVMADINQREEWWINFPVYQAHLKGAAALIAVQENGYGEIDSSALNAQDIAGPADAPAFSMSRRDAELIRARLAQEGTITVELDADSRVKRDQPAYNVWGVIPGKCEEKILLTAHYDSYFTGFQDDNTAVAMIISMARSLIACGYQPERTIVVCAMAAEEWGITNSKYDWSTGAWQQVFKVRPQWRGQTVIDLNFELPAHAHDRRDAIRCTYEYQDFLEDFVRRLPAWIDPKEIYPEGLTVCAPIETWSDDFSMAIGGIPSTVNDFSAGRFMETHYHSQFDNDDFYDEKVYRFHHQLYGLLLMEIDQTPVAPLNPAELFAQIRRSIHPVTGEEDETAIRRLLDRLSEAEELGDRLWARVREKNRTGEKDEALQQGLLNLFQKGQDYFVRLDWQDSVLFPQEAIQNNLRYLRAASACLKEGETGLALEAIYSIDNSWYAFLFDEAVYQYFTEYVLDQPEERLQWGAGRIVHHENLYGLVARLKKKHRTGCRDLAEELAMVREAEKQQMICYDDDIRYITRSVEKLIDEMKKLEEG